MYSDTSPRISQSLVIATAGAGVLMAGAGIATGRLHLVDVLFGFSVGVVLVWIAAERVLTRMERTGARTWGLLRDALSRESATINENLSLRRQLESVVELEGPPTLRCNQLEQAINDLHIAVVACPTTERGGL